LIGDGRWLCIPIALLWIALCYFAVTVRSGGDFGDDIAPSYRAALLVVEGRAQSIYQQLPPPAETDTAPVSGNAYVYPPLLAVILAPVTRLLSFDRFNRICLLVNLAGFAASLALVAQVWWPELLHPVRYGAMLLAMLAAPPFQSAVNLNQLQMSIVFLIALGIYFDCYNKGALAGAAIGIATFIKITPAAMLCAWISRRKLKNVAFAAFLVAALAILSILTAGFESNIAFLGVIRYFSETVDVAANNQSLRCLAFFIFNRSKLFWDVYPMNKNLILLEGMCEIILFLFFLFIRKVTNGEYKVRIMIGFCLAASLVLSPKSWDHYYIIMPILMMSVPQKWLGRGWYVCFALIFILNMLPIGTFLIWRQLYSAIIYLIGITVSVFLFESNNVVRGKLI